MSLIGVYYLLQRTYQLLCRTYWLLCGTYYISRRTDLNSYIRFAIFHVGLTHSYVGVIFLYAWLSPWPSACPVPAIHDNDVIMITMASQIISLTIVFSTVYSGADQRKHQSSASRAFVRGIRRWPVNSPHKMPVTREMFPFSDVIVHFSPRELVGDMLVTCVVISL